MPSAIRAEIREAAVAEYAAGTSSEAVAEKYSVSSSSVIAWVRAAGGSVRKKGAPQPKEGPNAYTGGWEFRGGIMRPLMPSRTREHRAVLSVRTSETWENGTARTGASTPAGPNHRYYSTQPRSEG